MLFTNTGFTFDTSPLLNLSGIDFIDSLESLIRALATAVTSVYYHLVALKLSRYSNTLDVPQPSASSRHY